MGEASSSVGGRWRLRTVPEHSWRATVDEGWWTDDTLGTWWPRGSPTGVRWASRSTRRCGRGRHVRRRRPRGPLAGRLAAASGASGRATSSVPAAELGRGRHHLLGRGLPRRGRRARSSTSTGPRRSTTSSAPPSPTSSSPPTGSATPTTSPSTTRCSPTDPMPLWLVVGDTPADAAARPAPPVRSTCSTATPIDGPAAGRSRRAGGHRVHLGHDARPEGRDPLAPHHRLRDPPARLHVSRRAARRRSPARRSVTSSACSTRSSSRCCASGR